MYLVRLFYTYVLHKMPPYYAHYPLWLAIWKPLRKFINVIIIPSIPFNTVRIFLYRIIGFKIGKNVFIGMKCYMDDIDPSMTIIKDDVTISYGCYFACHGKNQPHTPILIESGVYIGMRSNIMSGKNGITIGTNSIIGAGSLVLNSIAPDTTAYGVPAKIASCGQS
ncbi:MAG: acyltransferase [Sulfuricurvum sp.]|uniref:acyltransferase n=1 Tax=Sulfuricurvum sp. TaxID=2025608 RepID=UPI003566943B